MTCMKRIKSILCIMVAVTLVMTSFGPAPSASKADGRYIVTYMPGTDLNSQKPLLQALGVEVTQVLTLANALAIKIPFSLVSYVLWLLDPSNLNPLDLLNDNVVGVVNDLLTVIDPICPTTALSPIAESYRWGQKKIEVPAVDQQWAAIRGSAAVTVAVLDTGIQSHLDLDGRIGPGYNAIVGKGPPTDGHGHGTHMAGIIAAAKNQLGIIGVTGVESSIQIAAVKVLDDTGIGYLSSVINGLEWVVDNDIPLVNMSFGFSFSKESDATPLKLAIQSLYKAGVIMIASAGNRCTAAQASEDGGGDDCGPAATCKAPLTAITYPAAYKSWVIAVGASTIHDEVAAYSLSGPQLTVVAPGGEPDSGEPDNGQILSTNTGGLYGWGHGTSQAAAHVTGAVALVLQIQPGLLFDEVRDLLTQTAVKLPYSPDEQGAGRIDVKKMIKSLP